LHDERDAAVGGVERIVGFAQSLVGEPADQRLGWDSTFGLPNSTLVP
jgi:hypothetical protein